MGFFDRRADSDGFTLIELMVVILVIGILVSLAVPVYFTAQHNASVRTCQATLRTIDSVIQAYISIRKACPSSLEDLKPGFIDKIPEEPSGGSYSLVAATEEAPPYASCSAGHTY